MAVLRIDQTAERKATIVQRSSVFEWSRFFNDGTHNGRYAASHLATVVAPRVEDGYVEGER